ncbi:MAG: DUF134 domain-containing protein [bacterium]
MPRPRKIRRIGHRPDVVYFKPRGVPLRQLEELKLEADELEAIRLVDLEELSQVSAAKRMRVSQPTLARILSSARAKLAEALVMGKAIQLSAHDSNE